MTRRWPGPAKPSGRPWYRERVKGFDLAFSTKTALGHCLGLRLPPAEDTVVRQALATLPAEERALTAPFAPRRLVTFVGGRLALRAAFEELGIRHGPVVHDDRGAPVLPAGVAASISHKDDIAVAFVSDRGRFAGVDVESRQARATDIAPHVLRDEERPRVGHLPPLSAGEELLLRFSTKEALYKVLDPTLRRYVGFHEVAVEPATDGSAEVGLFLKSGEPPRDIVLRWMTNDDLGVADLPFFISTAVAG
jgi:4'-phosphopantetheinyl transferase EntD